MGRNLTNDLQAPAFIYTYAYTEEEQDLCFLEMRAFFGFDSKKKFIESDIGIDPSRSPFMKERIEVMYDGANLDEILAQVKQIQLGTSTFKVTYVNFKGLEDEKKLNYGARMKMERDIGWEIPGEFDLHQPDYDFGMIRLHDHLYFGRLVKNEAIWLLHQKKPHSYSTALSTRVARAISNIAVPNPVGISAIDPCCGIGNVLVEALSMNIDIVGRDINPLVTSGSRKNIAHFGYEGDVSQGAIADITTHYNVAIIDLPYNVYTHTSPEAQLSILKHARRIADKVVVVTIDTIDEMIQDAGFQIKDRCETRKGTFSRQILVCE
ncbi:tRNA G10 N-methylase Trm11 [Virgibacillus halotolerans]|nr:tRNA G10 N-methylase Trm11 [Virgibacillus halotolerans]